MKIIRADESNLDAMLDIENVSFSMPWSRQSFLFEIESGDARVCCAVEKSKVLGFAILHRCGDDGEIFNVAVNPVNRRAGVGKSLVDDLIAHAPKMGIKRIFLEVRRTNEPALALYKSAGFQICGIRKNYYEKPTEDAILMEAEI